MENLTHTLTGLMLARIGLNRLAPQATAALVLASNLPDIDFVYYLGGPLSYLQYHRHWTHGLPLSPILALLNIGILWLMARFIPSWKAAAWTTGSWVRAYLVSILGIVVHILFDGTNAYAVRAALPFSADWFSANIFYVVDPLILFVLLLAVAAPAISGLVAGEIGGRKSTGGGWAAFALLFILSYGGWRAMLHQRAVETLDSHVYVQGMARRVEAFPTAFSPFTWIGFVETDQSWGYYEFNLNAPFDPSAGSIAYKPPPNPAFDRTWQSAEGKVFRDFARFAAWRVAPESDPEGSVSVEANDLRFGPPRDPSFSFRTKYDKQLNQIEQTFIYGRPKAR